MWTTRPHTKNLHAADFFIFPVSLFPYSYTMSYILVQVNIFNGYNYLSFHIQKLAQLSCLLLPGDIYCEGKQNPTDKSDNVNLGPYNSTTKICTHESKVGQCLAKFH